MPATLSPCGAYSLTEKPFPDPLDHPPPITQRESVCWFTYHLSHNGRYVSVTPHKTGSPSEFSFLFLSITERGVLKSPTIIVDVSISPCSSIFFLLCIPPQMLCLAHGKAINRNGGGKDGEKRGNLIRITKLASSIWKKLQIRLQCWWGKIFKRRHGEGETSRPFRTYTRGKSRKNFNLYEATYHSNPYPMIPNLAGTMKCAFLFSGSHTHKFTIFH